VAGQTHPTTLEVLIDAFVKSLRPDQMQRIVEELSPDQEKLLRALIPGAELSFPQRKDS